MDLAHVSFNPVSRVPNIFSLHTGFLANPVTDKTIHIWGHPWSTSLYPFKSRKILLFLSTLQSLLKQNLKAEVKLFTIYFPLCTATCAGWKESEPWSHRPVPRYTQTTVSDLIQNPKSYSSKKSVSQLTDAERYLSPRHSENTLSWSIWHQISTGFETFPMPQSPHL